MTDNFKTLDEMWFKDQFEKYKIDLNSSDSKFDQGITPILDLSDYSFINFFDLLNLFLTLDYFQDFIGPTTLTFKGMNPYDIKQIMDINEYNKYRSSQDLKIQEWRKTNPQYLEAEQTYNLVSFLHHYGLFEALSGARDNNKLVIAGISPNLLKSLYAYSGIGKKILVLSPINSELTTALRLESSIQLWIQHLEEFTNHPIFSDGEFSRVLGYQLAYNVIEHSSFKSRNGLGSSGAICMQLIEKKKFSQYLNNYSKEFSNLFSHENTGVLEICVGDRGIGIYETLKNTYLNLYRKIGENKQSDVLKAELIKEVIYFAFDEIGSRKVGNARVGGVHALHRILKTISKYGGILRVRTGGYEIIYNLTESNLIRRSSGFGFEANSFKECIHPFGTQFQILIPLKFNSKKVRPIPIKPSLHPDKLPLIKIVSLSSYFSIKQYITYDSVAGLTGLVDMTNSLHTEPANDIIVYDFEGRDWTEEEISFVITTQESILHTKFCIGLNLPKGFPKLLRTREIMIIDEDKKKITGDTDFFDVLSSNKRLFPVFDNENNLTFLGLSKYEFDQILDSIYKSKKSEIDEKSVNDLTIDEPESEILKLYLNTNTQLFTRSTKLRPTKWVCKLNPDLIQSIIKELISKNFWQILHSSGSILEGGNQKFILPTSGKIVNRFYQISPMFHQNRYAFQLGQWFANAIISVLPSPNDSVLLVSTNAPSELMAKTISDALFPKEVFHINLSLYTKNSEELLQSTSDWKGIPLFILTDIFDRWKPIQEHRVLLQKDLKIMGVLSFIKYDSKLSEDFKIALEWLEITEQNIKIPHFIFSYIKTPSKYDSKEIEKLDKDEISIIDTFSTQEYKLQNLAKLGYKNIDRLRLLESENLLREGHWVYEQHHFAVTVCLKRLFNNDLVSSQITSQVLDIIKTRKINLLLIPLHSHIKEFIQNLLLIVKIHFGFSLEYYYCIATKGLTEKPFYILPKNLDNELKVGSKTFRILILDDAVATGSTQETILRSIIRAVDKNQNHLTVQDIQIYSVISRLGRAKNYFWESVSKLTSREREISLKFNYWIAIDIPVYDFENCPICQERQKLMFSYQSLKTFRNHSFVLEILNRINLINPHSTESPRFFNDHQRFIFNDQHEINIGNIQLKTVELALWQFYNLLHNGYPLMYLISELDAILESGEEKNENLEYLKSYCITILIKNWERVHLLFAENRMKDYIEKELYSGNTVSKTILATLIEKLPDLIKNKRSRDIVVELINLGIDQICLFKSEEELFKRDNLKLGIITGLYFYSHKIEEILEKDHQKEEKEQISLFRKKIQNLSESEGLNTYQRLSYKQINNLISETLTENEFLPSLYFVLENTVRPSRKGHHHEFLLPSLLSQISSGNRVLKENRILISDTIIYFLKCIDIIEQINPSIFDSRARKFLPELFKDLNKTIDLINNEKNWNSDTPNKTIIDHTSLVYNLFPHLNSNAIFQALLKTHFKVDTLILHLIEICKKFNLPAPNCLNNYEEDLNVLISTSDHHKKQIFTFLDNFIKPIDSKYEKNKLSYLVELNDSETEIHFHVYTNFCDYAIAKRNTIHGTLSINNSELNLFGIKTLVECLDEDEYTFHLRIKFLKGYKV